MTVVANAGHIEVFVEGYPTAVLTYDVDRSEAYGSVGFRTFRICGSKITNFSLTADSLPVDASELNALIAEAKRIDVSTLTKNSASALSNAIEDAETVLSTTSQKVADDALRALKKAVDNALESSTFAALCYEMERAREIISQGEGHYTTNTFESLKLSLRRAEALTEGSDEDAVSEKAAVLKERIDGLTAYIK